MKPVLVTGFPRSGTTWVARSLAAGFGARYHHEPDNEKLHVAALAAKRGLGRFPALALGDSAPAFDRLWVQSLAGVPPWPARAADKVYTSRFDTEVAVSGGGRQRFLGPASAAVLRCRPIRTEPLIVKSVHSPLCLEHVVGLSDCSVVVVTRDPRNVLASWLEMAMPDADRRLDERSDVRALLLDPHGLPSPSRRADRFERFAWQCALFSHAVRAALARNPVWATVEHESLAEAGVPGFESLARDLDRPWHADGSAFVLASARDGAGYEVNRDPTTLRHGWRRALSASQVRTVESVFRDFLL